MIKSALSLFLLLSSLAPDVRAGKLAAGPMQGHTTGESAKFWMLVKKTVLIELEVRDLLQDRVVELKKIGTDSLLQHGKYHLLITDFQDLQENGVFQLVVYLDGVEESQQAFRTYSAPDSSKNTTDVPQEFSFLTGSCAMSTPGIIKWSNGGPHYNIYAQMESESSDFMLWLGDNVYYLFGQGKNPRRMYNKRIRKRGNKKLNSFFRSRPHYAIWDDHDFGPDNSRGDFPLADTSLFIHQQFWANPYYGLSETGTEAGNYCHFKFIDVDFFLTDNRYTSTPPEQEGGYMLGEAQEEWLKKGLLESTAPFKFVAMGSQALNDLYRREAWILYEEERQRVFDFIAHHQIKNVIFLTGDRHHTELIQRELSNGVVLRDLTCSPLTSYSNRLPSDAENPERVAGTLYTSHNYGKIRIATNTEGRRFCEINVLDVHGELVWQEVILSEE